jgi:hypothetical protein
MTTSTLVARVCAGLLAVGGAEVAGSTARGRWTVVAEEAQPATASRTTARHVAASAPADLARRGTLNPVTQASSAQGHESLCANLQAT